MESKPHGARSSILSDLAQSVIVGILNADSSVFGADFSDNCTKQNRRLGFANYSLCQNY